MLDNEYSIDIFIGVTVIDPLSISRPILEAMLLISVSGRLRRFKKKAGVFVTLLRNSHCPPLPLLSLSQPI